MSTDVEEFARRNEGMLINVYRHSSQRFSSSAAAVLLRRGLPKPPLRTIISEMEDAAAQVQEDSLDSKCRILCEEQRDHLLSAITSGTLETRAPAHLILAKGTTDEEHNEMRSEVRERLRE